LIISQGDEKILESHCREMVVVFCDLRGYTLLVRASSRFYATGAVHRAPADQSRKICCNPG
jgi:hypothetical protein